MARTLRIEHAGLDRRRLGFVESQGGGTILLARGDLALKMGLPVLGVVAYAQSFGDGVHTSIPAPGLGALGAGRGGRESRLAQSLAKLGVTADDIAVISKHDTSTLANDPKYAKMKLVATVYGDDQPEKSTTEMEALLSNYPNLKGVIAPTTVGIAAAAQVVQSRGIAEKVAVTGLGLPSEMRDFIKDGTVKAFQLWSPYNEGWLAAHFAKGVLEGSIKNEVGSTFEVPNLGTITINANNSINTQAELTTFTPENIDEFNF